MITTARLQEAVVQASAGATSIPLTGERVSLGGVNADYPLGETFLAVVAESPSPAPLPEETWIAEITLYQSEDGPAIASFTYAVGPEEGLLLSGDDSWLDMSLTDAGGTEVALPSLGYENFQTVGGIPMIGETSSFYASATIVSGTATVDPNVGWAFYGWTATDEPAVSESLMNDLRSLYASLVSDFAAGAVDRRIEILETSATVGLNGERTTSLSPVTVAYGQIKYLTDSNVSRALGRPTGEQVVEITLPYDALNASPDGHVFRVTAATGAIDYIPVPGDNNYGTSYRAYLRFRAKRRS